MPMKISNIIFNDQIDTGYLITFCYVLVNVSSHIVGGSIFSMVLETNLSVSINILMICIPFHL